MIRVLSLLVLLAGPAAAEGGTLRLLARSAAGSIDPQVNYTAQFWQVFAGTHDGLVAFRKVAGARGTEIVPDLAEAVPVAEGLTYRFRVRAGVRFSDGSPVRGADVAASFRRIFRVGSPTAATFYGAIVGAEACLAAPAACALPGVRAEGNEVTIALSRADPEFLQKLALPHASVVPEGAPGRDSGVVGVAGTGPYRVASYDPNAALVLERNPFFRVWNAEAQPAGLPDAIRYEFGLEAEAQVTAVLTGRADWMFDTPPADRLAEIGARAGGLVHLNPAHAIWFVPLNTRIPPFDDVRVRRAFAMAVDRRVAVRLFGGGRMATALCTAVPEGLAGSGAACPFALDVAAARRLVAEAGAVGRSVTLVVDDSGPGRAMGTWLLDVLGDIGLRPRLLSLSGNIQFTYIQNTGNRVQASLTSWYADYPSAANILAGNFGCAAFREGSDSSTNIPGSCDPALDARLQAAVLAGDAEGVAAVDRAIMEQAPAVVLFSPRYIDLVSARVGGFTYHETFRFLFSRAVLR